MLSCALRILLAATISIALVIFCVFFTLPIFDFISLAPDMTILPKRLTQLPSLGRFKSFNRFS